MSPMFAVVRLGWCTNWCTSSAGSSLGDSWRGRSGQYYCKALLGDEVAGDPVDLYEVFGEQLPLRGLSVGPHLLRPRRPGYDRRHHRLCHKPRYRQLQDRVPPLLGKGLKPLHSVEVAGIGEPTCPRSATVRRIARSAIRRSETICLPPQALGSIRATPALPATTLRISLVRIKILEVGQFS